MLLHETFISKVWVCVLGLEVWGPSYSLSVKKSFSNWYSHRGWRQPWNSKLTFRGVVGLLPVSDKCKNSEWRAKWMGEERRAPKSPIFLSRCRNPGPESRETGPRSHSKMETFGFGKASPQSGLSFLFCPQPWKTWEAGGIWPGGQAVWGTWLWNVLGKQDAFSCRPNKPTGLCVARKGSGYLPSASVSFGLSSPAAKWPKRVRFDKSWKVRGGRWQDVRDQSLRDVPEPPLLHFLSKGWESQRSLLSPSTASPPPRLWPRPQTSHLISGGRG